MNINPIQFAGSKQEIKQQVEDFIREQDADLDEKLVQGTLITLEEVLMAKHCLDGIRTFMDHILAAPESGNNGGIDISVGAAPNGTLTCSVRVTISL